MLHFFRKIRANLLYKNQVKKYFLYALGEIILVMAGILLALYFDNLSTEKENAKKENWYLINIVEDIEYQKGDLKDLKEDCIKGIFTGQKLIKDYNKYLSFSKIDSLNEKLNILMTANNFPNINNTYQELVNSGQQTLINNKDLSIDIIDYYLFCEDNFIDFNNNNNNIFYKEVFPVFFKFSQLNLDNYNIEGTSKNMSNNDVVTYLNKELDKPASSLQLLNAIKMKILILNNHLEMIIETQEVGKDLIKKIDNYLGLKPEDVINYD